MIFDARDLARGWLSVALASADDDERPALHRTVSIESYPTGVRLTATDSYILLSSWVHAIDHAGEPEPGPDESPAITGVAIDLHGRGKGFLSHVWKLARDEDAPLVEVRLSLGVTELDDPNRPTLDGIEAEYVVLEHPDNERIKLRAYEGEYPQWRKVVASFTEKRTSAVALNPEMIGRLAKLGKLHPGCPLLWHFGGENRAARLEIQSEPYVSGLVMPVRWDFVSDRPDPLPEKPKKGDDE